MAKIVNSQSRRAAVAAEIRARLAKRDNPRDIIWWLGTEHDVAFWGDASPQRLRILGITCSCTAGLHGLLTNWCAAVERFDGAQS
jgi:hypothetical protein